MTPSRTSVSLGLAGEIRMLDKNAKRLREVADELEAAGYRWGPYDLRQTASDLEQTSDDLRKQ